MALALLLLAALVTIQFWLLTGSCADEAPPSGWADDGSDTLCAMLPVPDFEVGMPHL